jgi:anti-sigma regulatory factor (Ser/Thr protein kinase)
MTKAATETDIDVDEMIAFVLLPEPEQVGMARRLVRAALEYRGFGYHADDAEIITSELVTNAIQHAYADSIGDKISVILMRVWHKEAVAIIVSDSSPVPPVKHTTMASSAQGRGLQVVEALSAYWAWHPEDGGKAVYAILAKEE